MSNRWRRTLATASVVLLGVLVGCAPEPDTAPPAGPTTPAPSPSTEATATPEPTASPTASAQIPTDCRAILSESVLAQLADHPLNDPAFGPSGVQPDGSLRCIWADPGADTTGLTTTISRMSRGPALDMLNELADEEDFTCYTPDEGTRCEKTWPSPRYPVTDGRTLFWRDDILIDTTFSNLAPSGYTSSIVQHLWP